MRKLTMAAAALVACSLMAAPAFAQLSGYYRIMARHSGKALVVQGASTANSAAVVQYTYGGANTNDEWELRDIGSGYYRVINRLSSKDMVVQSASTAEGAAIIQYVYGGATTNDEWALVDLGSGYYQITNRLSGKSVEVASGATGESAAVDQRTYSGATYQQFEVVSLSGSSPTPTPTPTPVPGATPTPTPTPAPATPTPTPTATPGSGTCARTVNVSTSSALSSAASSAQAGDCIVVANGTYSGFTVTADGTSGSPISIKAANRLGATISSGDIYLNGANWVTVEGFSITTPGVSRSLDNASRKAAVYFMSSNDSRLTRCRVVLSGVSGTTYSVYLGGNSNRNQVDHDEFTGSVKYYVFPSGSTSISGVTPPSKGTSGYQSWANGGSAYNPNMARNTRIHRNYFHDKPSGSGEAICLGGIGITGDYQDAYSLVENNLFVNCDGDAEMIASKSSSNTIRLNTIRTSGGMISLRAGNKCKVQDNIQIQNGKSGTAGIKIYEHDHTVTGNYIDGPADYALLIGAGDSYLSTSFGHAACVRCVMDNNIAINLNVRPAIVGHGGSGVAPSGSTFRNNQLRGSVSPLIALSNVGDTVISGNTTSGSNPALPRTPLSTSDVGTSAP